MKKILFVDDEKNVLDGIRRMLHSSRDRWDMEFVTGGEGALALCEERSFDVIVSDLRMPGMDGAELLGRMRSRHPGTARIILSGYSEAELATRAVPVAYQMLIKPCNPVELKETIERVCTLQDVLCKPALRELIGAIGELPALSSTYMALSRALGQADTSVAMIASIIEQDVGMSAKMLQLVNSGFFGLSRRATGVEQAVSYLGTDTIKTLALYSETFRIFVPSVKIPASFWQMMQRHSQRAAIIAGALPITREIREVALIAALLHDAGTLALASTMADQFCGVLDEMRDKGCTQVEAEESLLGISHAEIGAYLLGLWGINSVAVEAIAHHHHPSRIGHKGLDCSLAVYLSNLLAHEVEIHPDNSDGDHLSETDRRELEALGLLDQFPVFWGRAVEALGQTV
jgi:HD-like signal output (HDOD) protein